MVEPSDIRITNYFSLDGKLIALTADHFTPETIEKLVPLEITRMRLDKLGFVLENMNRYKASGLIKLHIKEVKAGWLLQLEGTDWKRKVNYIHQLQNLWYELFQDELKNLTKPPNIQIDNRVAVHLDFTTNPPKRLREIPSMTIGERAEYNRKLEEESKK